MGRESPRRCFPSARCLSLAKEAGSGPQPQVLVRFPASKQESTGEMEKQNNTERAPRGWQRQAALPALGTPRQLLRLPWHWLLANRQAPQGEKEPQVVPAPSGPLCPPARGVLRPLEEHGPLAGTARPVPGSGCRGAGAPKGRRRESLSSGFLSPDVTTRDCGIQLSSVFLPVTVGVSPLRFKTDTLPWKTNACNKAKERACRGRPMLVCSRHCPGRARRLPATHRTPGPAGSASRSPVPRAAAGPGAGPPRSPR